MTLYDHIAIHYDDIFPLNEETLAFMRDRFQKGKTLDLGCGTGEYSLALSRLGFDTLGIDIDQRMIDICLAKAKRLSLLSRFLRGNFLDVVYQNQYENVFCIGNTFVHLESIEEMKLSLQHIYDTLKPSGTFIVQIINYDRVLDQEIKSLPKITNNGVTFVREYEFDGDKIRFLSTLKTKDKEEKNESILFPIRSDDLIALLTEVGFKEIVARDDFSEKPFNKKKSMRLVLVAKK